MSSSLRFRFVLLGAAGLLLLPLAILGQNPFVGPRGTAMAGAATAVADDGSALWTNPAGLARDPRLDVALFGSAVATNRNEFTAAIDRLASIDLDRILQGRDLDRIPRALRDLQLLTSSGTGIVGSGVAGAVVGKSGVAIGIGDVAYGSVYPTVDLVRIFPGTDPATGLAFNRQIAKRARRCCRGARAASSPGEWS